MSPRWLAWALLLPAAITATAGERIHDVAAGEDLASIARLYYDDARGAEVIRVHNGLPSGSVARGRRLRIPLSDLHRVRPGESWSGLAHRYWGKASLAGELAFHAGGSRDAVLGSGLELRVPVLISYPLAAGETLAAVSRRFYGHSSAGEPLARLNGVADPRRLRVGTPIRVPIQSRRTPKLPGNGPNARAIHAAETPPVAAAGSDRHPSEFAAPLRHAVRTYRDGNWGAALLELEELRPLVRARGSRAEQLQALEHLTIVYTAFDRIAEACSAYRALRRLAPQQRWDPDRISPKVIERSAECTGG